jgi:chromosome segregation ATPase
LGHGCDICAIEEEMGKVGEVMVGIKRSLGQQEGEWKAAIGDLDQKAKEEQSEVSKLKEVLENLHHNHEQLREIVVRQSTELAETVRRNSELSSCVQQLEEKNWRLRESSEGLKGQLVRVEAGHQSKVAHLEAAIAAGGSKMKEDLGNVERDVAKLKVDMMVMMKMTGKTFLLHW